MPVTINLVKSPWCKRSRAIWRSLLQLFFLNEFIVKMLFNYLCLQPQFSATLIPGQGSFFL